MEDKEEREFKKRIIELVEKIEKTECSSNLFRAEQDAEYSNEKTEYSSILLRAEQEVKELNEKLKKRTRNKYTQFFESLENKDGLLLEIKIKTQEGEFRNEKIIVLLTYWIRDYYRQRAEKGQFQEEINELYGLIAEQLKKPLVEEQPKEHYVLDPDPNKLRADNFRILEKMLWVLGIENVKKDFEKKYKEVDFGFERLSVRSFRKEIIYFILITAFFIIVLIFFMNGYDGVIG